MYTLSLFVSNLFCFASKLPFCLKLLLCDLSTDSIPWRQILAGKVGHNSSVVVSLGFQPSSSPNASFHSLALKQFVEDDPQGIGMGRIVFCPVGGGSIFLSSLVTNY
jgi:hypothetical protein